MKYSLLFLTLLAFVSVSVAQEKEFEQWKTNRIAELTGEDGWLNLAGLIWLEDHSPYLEEVNASSLGFSEKSGLATLGKFEIGQDSVWFEPTELALQKKSNTPQSKRMLVYPIPCLLYTSDAADE